MPRLFYFPTAVGQSVAVNFKGKPKTRLRSQQIALELGITLTPYGFFGPSVDLHKNGSVRINNHYEG